MEFKDKIKSLTQITLKRNLPDGLTKIFDFVMVKPQQNFIFIKFSSIQHLMLNLGLI